MIRAKVVSPTDRAKMASHTGMRNMSEVRVRRKKKQLTSHATHTETHTLIFSFIKREIAPTPNGTVFRFTHIKVQ